MSWIFGLVDLDGTLIGRLHWATERKLSLPLNGLPTAQVRLRLDDPLVDEIISRNGDVLLKVYQDSTLRFIGDFVSGEEVAEEKHTMLCNFAGPLWRLQSRLLGIPYPHAARTWEAPANEIIEAWLNQTNTNFDSGVRKGTFDSLYSTSIGTESSYAFKPFAEALKELQTSKVAFPIGTPPSYEAVDTFQIADHTVGDLDGQDDNLGNTWSTYGDLEDFQMQSGGSTLYRGWPVSGYPSPNGRWAFLTTPSTLGATLVGMDWTSSQVGAVGLYSGIFCRHNGQAPPNDAWVLAQTNVQAQSLHVVKKLAGQAQENLATFTFTPPSAFTAFPDWYSMRFLVDDDGNFTFWHFANGLPMDAPKIIGHDSDLASDGPLATGRVGIQDSCIANDVNRGYDNFFASDYTGPLSFDFEIAPTEPTADASGYPGSLPYIGTLNVRTQIGTSKPEVIFEYGRSMKSYTRRWSREELCNIAYVLPPGFEAGVTDVGEIAASVNQGSIDARGQYEDVVSEDLQDPQLRLALASAHAGIRGSAKQEITFVPSVNAPEFGDYIVGDIVTGRATYNGTVRFNALFRVYGVEITIDEEGKTEISPTLVPE